MIVKVKELLFDVINTKAKGIGTSLSRYLNRDKDDISWVATNLILKPEARFSTRERLQVNVVKKRILPYKIFII